MQVTAATLNKIAAMLNTTDKNTVITVAIGSLVKSGVDVEVAVDAVLGQGAYRKMAGEVWTAMRAS